MPALPNVPKVIRVVLRYTDLGGDTDVINRFFLQYTGSAPTNADLNGFCAAVGTHWGTDIATLFSSDITLTQVSAEDLTAPTAAVGVDATVHAGTRAGNPLGAGTAFVLSGLIARRYRGGHPRLYLQAGSSGDLISQNTWAPGFVTSVEDGWEGFITNIDGVGWTGYGSMAPVNVSYYQGFHPFTFPSGRVRNLPNLRVGGPVVDVITDFRGNHKLGSQRRRNLQGV